MAGTARQDAAGRRRRETPPGDAAPAADDHTREVQTAVFAVLGLLLAFTYSMAISRFDARKQALTAEATAIETAYLRTQLLPTPLQTTQATLLRQYVDLRLAAARPDWCFDTRQRQQTQDLQRQMWPPRRRRGEAGHAVKHAAALR